MQKDYPLSKISLVQIYQNRSWVLIVLGKTIKTFQNAKNKLVEIAVHRKGCLLLRNLKRKFYQINKSLEEGQGRRGNQKIGLQI